MTAALADIAGRAVNFLVIASLTASAVRRGNLYSFFPKRWDCHASL